jgi:hypothetical protein
MIFTWDYNNMCIIFDWWHVRSTAHLLVSLLAIIALTAGYEAVRAAAASYDAASSSTGPNGSDHDSSMYTLLLASAHFPLPQVGHGASIYVAAELALLHSSVVGNMTY